MAKHTINFHYNIVLDGSVVNTCRTYFDLTDSDLKIITDDILEHEDHRTGLFANLPATVFDKIMGEAVDDARTRVKDDISKYKVVLENYIPLDLLYLLPEHAQNVLPEEAFNDPDTDADLAALRAEFL
ncbi:MAG: hypothetical protein MJZ15_04660 [Bacteroidales bacterium]|nr:hypothetical protein [Bacteroidales bacterium]